MSDAWNDTARDFAKDECIYQRFEAQVDRAPEAIAVVFDGEQLTYRELDRRANALARRLIALGVGPETLVGLCLPQSADLIVGVLGILKSGAAYVPLDPSYPHDRLAYMIDDAGFQVAVADERFPAVLLEGLTCIGPRREKAEGNEDDARVRGRGRPEGLAYVIYTSGSSGRPKGVAVTHRGVVNLAEHFPLLGAGPDARVLQFSSPSFDASVWEIFYTLTRGGMLVVPRPEERLSFESLLVRQRIDIALLPPSLLATLPSAPPSTLPMLIVGGEACPQALADRWATGRHFINAYGPTEGTVAATTDTWREGEVLCLGRPLANVQCYVLGPDMEVLPVGVAGELYIGGIGLARGYWNHPALTAERFVPHPFGDVPGARLYRSGDLCCRRADGALTFLGRVDHQVKIRGFRIELGEIEAQLQQHPSVREAVVLAREDTPGDKRLVAYIVGRGAAPDVSALRDHLARKLLEHMVPSAFVVLDALPLTPNGKIDRKALRAPAADASQHSEYVAPLTPTERALARIWCEVLGVDQVGIRDDFFELGGHSLLAPRLVARIRHELGVELRAASVFESSTLAEQAQRIDNERRPLPHLPGRTQPAGPRCLGLSEGPAALLQPYWASVQKDDADLRAATFRYVEAWHLRGRLERTVLARAIEAVACRHEILRTNYSHDGKGLRQIIRPPTSPFLPAYTHTPPSSRDRPDEPAHVLARAVDSLLSEPFDLGNGPVVRVHLAELAPDDHLLVVLYHHIMFDGPSIALFHQDLAAAYDRLRAAATADPATIMDKLPYQFLDVSEFLREHAESEAGRADLDYWTRRFAGVEPTATPVDFARDEVDRLCASKPPHVATFASEVVTFDGPTDLAMLVQEASRRELAPPLAYLLACLAIVLHSETGQGDIALQTSVNIRPLLGDGPLIGGFNNPINVRVDLSKPTTHRELLLRVRDDFSEACSHLLVFAKDIVPAHASRVNLGFTGGGAVGSDGLRLGDAHGTFIPVDLPGRIEFDLRPVVLLDDRSLTIELQYNPRLFRRDTVIRLCERYVQVMRAMADEPDRLVGAS